MGISAKPPVIRLRNRPGVALPSAIFGIVVVGMITAGAWSVTELDLKATNNRVDAATALRLEHTAETHAIAVLRNRLGDTINFTRLIRGHDNVFGTADEEDFGSSTNYRTLSVIASGSIKVGGKKIFMKSAHPDGIVLMGGGDMDLQGEAGFDGMVYAGAQCYVSGKPYNKGQLVCKNKPWVHPGENWVQLSDNKGMLISGDATFEFTCNTMLTSSFGVMAWYPTVGT